MTPLATAFRFVYQFTNHIYRQVSSFCLLSSLFCAHPQWQFDKIPFPVSTSHIYFFFLSVRPCFWSDQSYLWHCMLIDIIYLKLTHRYTLHNITNLTQSQRVEMDKSEQSILWLIIFQLKVQSDCGIRSKQKCYCKRYIQEYLKLCVSYTGTLTPISMSNRTPKYTYL